MKPLVEICLSDVESALGAQAGGADRVELCSNLAEGGITPSHGLISLARDRIDIDLHVLIRPRPGDFVYSEFEFDVMRRDILEAKRSGVTAVVIGALDAEGRIDARCRDLVEVARPLSVTFHRAFDHSKDLGETLEVLVELGIDRVLTSGGAASAAAGTRAIAELVKASRGRIEVLPGAGIDANNANKILRATGAREIHVGSAVCVEVVRDPSDVQARAVPLGPGGRRDDGSLYRVSEARVRELVTRLAD